MGERVDLLEKLYNEGRISFKTSVSGILEDYNDGEITIQETIKRLKELPNTI